MLCGRVLQRGRGAEVQRSRGVVFPVCAVVVSAFMQRAEGCCGCFCIFAENKEIHGVQGAIAGLSLHCPGVGTVQGHAQFV